LEVIPSDVVTESKTDVLGGHIRTEIEQKLYGD